MIALLGNGQDLDACEQEIGGPRQLWHLSHRADPAAARLADRHYNRQKPGTPQFAPTGSCVVFLTADAKAFWITSAPFAEYVRHAWRGAWVCSAFRNEGQERASELIRLAVAATLAHYGAPPPLGMVTFINRAKVRPTKVHGRPVFGWTYRKAGFRDAGETKGGLLALRLSPEDMPAPLPALPRTMRGSPLFDAALDMREARRRSFVHPGADMNATRTPRVIAREPEYLEVAKAAPETLVRRLEMQVLNAAADPSFASPICILKITGQIERRYFEAVVKLQGQHERYKRAIDGKGVKTSTGERVSPGTPPDPDSKAGRAAAARDQKAISDFVDARGAAMAGNRREFEAFEEYVLDWPVDEPGRVPPHAIPAIIRVAKALHEHYSKRRHRAQRIKRANSA